MRLGNGSASCTSVWQNDGLRALALVLFGGLFPLAAAWSAGRAVSRRHPEWPWPIVFGIGCALLSGALFFLHLFSAVRPWTLLLLGAAAIAAGLRRPRFEWPSRAWLAGAPFLLLYLVHALAPEIQPDAVTYHLGLVAEWQREGGFTPRVDFYGVLPQGLEMLFSMAFAFGGHSAAKLVHLAFVIATAALIADAAWRLKTANGIPAALLYACSPVVAVCGTSAYNDAALAFAIAAAFYALLLWEWDGGRGWVAAAGAMAGFAYAVKLPGIVIAPAIVVWLLMRRKWREALLAGCAAAAVGAPWMLRTAAMSGNPVAPLFNRWFENPHFHVSTEEGTTRFLRTYDARPAELPLEVTVRGARTGGLAGPVFMLAPIALLALRRREGRWVLAACALAAVPWLFNAGTRFLMPALVLLSLAMMMALPHKLAWVLAGLQMIAAWPHGLDLWTVPGAWHLRSVPWQAALRIEPEETYLRRTLWEYRIAELLRTHTRRGDLVLDLEVNPPSAYLDATVLTWWHAASADRALDALKIGMAPLRDSYWEGLVRWKRQPLHAVRVRLADAGAGGAVWGVQELELIEGGKPVFPGNAWETEASPNPWESPLAFDRNPVSRWQSWREATAGMWLAVHFPAPLTLDGARLVVFQPPARTVVAVEALDADRTTWKTLAEPSWRGLPAFNYRRRAMGFVQREGFAYILTRTGDEALALVGRDLVESAGDWGVNRVAETNGVYLLKTLPTHGTDQTMYGFR